MRHYKQPRMSSTLRNILLTVNSLALVASILWAISKPDFEPIISVLVLIATLIGLWVSDNSKQKKISQKQKSGNSSINYQSGRNINIQK